MVVVVITVVVVMVIVVAVVMVVIVVMVVLVVVVVVVIVVVVVVVVVVIWFLISSFRRVLNVAFFLLGDTPASEFYVPTFRNILSIPSSYVEDLTYRVFRNVGT